MLLSAEDCRRLLETFQALREMASRRDVPRAMVALVSKLVPADIASYTAVNPVAGTISGFAQPGPPDIKGLADQLSHHLHEHPVINHHISGKCADALKIGDFISQPQFHDTGLYQDFYRPLETEFQISLPIPTRKPIIAAIVLNRRAIDFSERDRAVLDFLQPQLAAAFETAQVVSRLNRGLRRHKDVLELLPQGVVVLAGNNQVTMWTEKARLWLGKYFPGPARKPKALPEALCDWLRANNATPEIGAPAEPVKMVSRGADRLLIRLVRAAGSPPMLVLEEYRPIESARPLEALGLSPRQAEVLLGIAQGLSNDQAAKKHEISIRTVQKHIEAIYQTLGVSSRNAASTIAWQRLGRAGEVR